MESKARTIDLAKFPTLTLARHQTLYISDPNEHLLSRVDPIKDIIRRTLERLPSSTRGHVVASIGEFIGTIFFFFLAFGAVEVATISTRNDAGVAADSKPTVLSTVQLLYMSLGAGFSLVVTAWSFFRISGGLFNPAVTVGMYLIGAINFIRCVLLFIIQCIAAIVASYITKALFRGGLNVGTSLKPGTTVSQGVVIEMLLTAQLAFTIFMLAAEKQEATFMAPVGIGLSVFLGELVGILWTGGAMNPARSLGPAVANHNFPPEHWIYWVGPITGSILAVLLFKLMKAFEYETANDAKESESLLPLTNNPNENPPPIPLKERTFRVNIPETEPSVAARTRHSVSSPLTNKDASSYLNTKSHRKSIAAPGHLERRETEANISEHDANSPIKGRSRATTHSRFMEAVNNEKGSSGLPFARANGRYNRSQSYGRARSASEEERGSHELV